MGMKLYDINDQLYQLLENGFDESCIDEETGEILFDIANEKIKELSITRQEKLEGLGCYLRDLLTEAEAIKLQKQVLAQRQKSKENKAQYLQIFIENEMKRFGDIKFETNKIALSLRKSTVLEGITDKDIDKIPENLKEDFIKTDIKYSVKIGELKKAIIDGSVKIEGINKVEKMNLQIK